MMFKARKPKPIRKKSSSLEDEEETNPQQTEPAGDQATSAPPTPQPSSTSSSAQSTPINGSKENKTPATTPSSSGKPKQPILLSFEDEGEEEEFTEKKSSRSKRMTKNVKESKVRPLARDLNIVSTASAAMSGGAGEYTPEKLAELRRNAVTYTRPKADPAVNASNENPFGVDPELPTAEQIHAARERRAKMREGGGSTAKDFIPLNNDGEGRLVREEGEDDDQDEEGRDSGSRIDFNSVKDKGRNAKPNMEGAIDLDGEEDDEEMKRWEMDRIRKGVGAQEMKKKNLEAKAKRPPSARTSTSASLSAFSQIDLTRDKPTISIDSITKDINVTLQQLQASYKSHAVQLERINEELERANTQSTALKEEVKSGAEEYSFFAGMKVYVSDLLDCLGAKAELVEHAEDKLMAAHRVHGAKNRTYIQNKIEAKTAEMKTIVEEMAGYAQPQAPVKREEKEKKKRARGEEEGWSSDEESSEVNAEFEKAKAEAREEGKAVFADVAEEYSSIAAIKERFEKWKNEFGTSYKQAYIAISMPQLFSPYVRLQLLERDLLPRDPLDTMGWYTDLLEYGRGEGGQGLDDPDDEDNFLVPKLVEKVVVPRILDALTHQWNPQSKSGNALALSGVREALDYADAKDAEHVKEVVASVYGGLQQAVMEVNIPTFALPKEKGENHEREREPWEFTCRMFWRATKLLRNVAAWHSVIATKPLQHLALDNFLNQKLLPFLRSIRDIHPSLFLDACESILDSLPPSWLINNDGGKGGVAPTFGLFHDQVVRVAKVLDGKKEKDERQLLERVTRVLTRLHDQETARSIKSIKV